MCCILSLNVSLFGPVKLPGLTVSEDIARDAKISTLKAKRVDLTALHYLHIITNVCET